jgi:Flp pilus assembly pilin Flp
MLTDTRAADMAEYAIIAAILLAVAYVAFTAFGAKIISALTKAGNSLDNGG